MRDASRLRPRIGVMLQEGGLYPGLKPLELLHLFAAYYDDAESPGDLLDTVGLRDAAGTSVRRLSLGHRDARKRRRHHGKQRELDSPGRHDRRGEP